MPRLYLHLVPGQKFTVGEAVVTIEAIKKAPSKHRRQDYPMQVTCRIEAPPDVRIGRELPPAQGK